MKLTALFIFLMMATGLFAQWTGTYIGVTNGDQVTLTLDQNENSVTGTMKDSYQHFDIAGTVEGDQFSGTATETSFQLEFHLDASKTGNALECKLSITVLDNLSETTFTVLKVTSDENTAPVEITSPSTIIPFPKDATFPVALTGTWTQNESYNSGSGDNFMGANFSQSMTFHSDGTLSEGNSSASMSGSNYSNQSSGAGSGKMEGIGWYAKQKNFYLLVLHEGNWTSVPIGTWYAENRNLLLTDANGEKILLSK